MSEEQATKRHDDGDYVEPDPHVTEHENETPGEALSVDLILDEVFRYLSIHDLLSCSLVTKKWNFNSRYFLREKRNSLAKVQGCRDLKKLNDLLTQSIFPLPFNGLFISGGHSCVKFTDPEEFYEFLCEDPVIFTRLKLRLVKQTGLDCPAIQFVRKYFTPESPLEHLEIVNLPNKIYTLRNTFGMDINLENLKSVRIPFKKHDGLVEEILSAAGNIKKIFGPVGEEESRIVRQKNLVPSLKEFIFEPETPIQIESLKSLIDQRPALEILKISSTWFKSHGDLSGFANAALSLIKSSTGSLRQLSIGHLDLILLISLDFPILIHVRHIAIGYSSQADKLEGSASLRKINFQHYFPNLQSMEILATGGVRHTPWYMTQEFKEAPEEFVCPSVTKLILSEVGFRARQQWFEWMRALLPNIKEFGIHACHELGSYLSLAWTTWPDLVQVNINDLGKPYGKRNVDSTFCGMSEEEVQSLTQKDEEFLKNYQYAPVEPCVLSLKNLERMNFQAQHCQEILKRPNSNFLSEITGHLVFRRMPALTVQLARKECSSSCNPCEFLDQLKPFVKFRDQ